FDRRFEGEEPRLVSSPKKRCMETLEPLARELGLGVKADPILDEGLGLEKRAQEFAKRWSESKDSLVVACSHRDFIPTLLAHFFGFEIELKKGAWAQVDWVDGRARLIELIQRP